jgi:hypothetical protein
LIICIDRTASYPPSPAEVSGGRSGETSPERPSAAEAAHARDDDFIGQLIRCHVRQDCLFHCLLSFGTP